MGIKVQHQELGRHGHMRVEDCFHYDPQTGVLYRKLQCRLKPVVTKDKDRYIVVTFNKRQYRATHIIWRLVYGVWPTFNIDHINNVRDDNRLCNLKDITPQQNSQKRLDSTIVGIAKVSNSSSWRAYFKGKHLGSFVCLGRAWRARTIAWILADMEECK